VDAFAIYLTFTKDCCLTTLFVCAQGKTIDGNTIQGVKLTSEIKEIIKSGS